MKGSRVLVLALLLALAAIGLWRMSDGAGVSSINVAPAPVAPRTVPSEPLEPEAVSLPEGERRVVLEAEPAPAPTLPRAAQTATLELSLIDAATGLAFAGTIELWRLGLPEDEEWTAGDLSLGSHQVPLEGLRIADLSTGSYRATCHQRRFGSDDPPAFELVAPLRSIALDFERPRDRAVTIVLLDEAGEELREAESLPNKGHSITARNSAPEWPRPRRRKQPPYLITVGGGGGGSFGSRHHVKWRPLKHGPRGFALGTFREDAANTEIVFKTRIRAAGRCTIDVAISGEDLGETRYVAACVTPESVLSRLLLPEGGDASAFAATVRIRPQVRRWEEGDRSAIWRELEVEVAVDHPDYEPLSFRYSPAVGLQDHWLTPRRKQDS